MTQTPEPAAKLPASGGSYILDAKGKLVPAPAPAPAPEPAAPVKET